MKKAWVGLLAGLALLLTQGAARADVFSVFADAPVASSLELDKQSTVKADGVSGYKVGVTLPIFLGLAYESYAIKLSKSAGDFDVSMADVFLNLPFPVVNLAIGLGAGTGTSNGNAGDFYKAGQLTQYWASIGIPFAVLFDVHLGYHVFSGSLPGKPNVPDSDVKGTMTSLGVKVGF
ncbi:MAG TPA: hypothetical protein VF678_00410 [bacterium]